MYPVVSCPVAYTVGCKLFQTSPYHNVYLYCSDLHQWQPRIQLRTNHSLSSAENYPKTKATALKYFSLRLTWIDSPSGKRKTLSITHCGVNIAGFQFPTLTIEANFSMCYFLFDNKTSTHKMHFYG